MSGFESDGVRLFEPEQELKDWVTHVAPLAHSISQDPVQRGAWLRCGGTWFVGVNALPNDTDGRIAGGPGLSGSALAFASKRFGQHALDQAQISVIYPGYPQRSEAESTAAFRFRRDRDAAHVDGLLPVGSERRRYLQEPHAYVIGVPLDDCRESPMVVWLGSHRIIQRAFREALQGIAPKDWAQVDLTEVYQTTRRLCFNQCHRVAIRVSPGGAYVIHPLSLHGVAPWSTGSTEPAEGRMVAYFRPAAKLRSPWLEDLD